MKKIIFVFILSILFISNTCALSNNFDVNIDKININNKSSKLISELDKEYKIETVDFKTKNDNEEKVKEFVKNLISISLSDKSIDEINKELSKYIYTNPEYGAETLTSTVTLKTFIDELNGKEISYDYVKIIRVVTAEEGIFAFAYIPNAVVSGEVKDIVLTFWLKEVDGNYKIYFPWINFGDKLDEYFNKIANNESEGKTLGGTYKSISLSGNKNDPSEEDLIKIYNENLYSNVQIVAMKENGVGVYASGFFIREGVVVTTWSTFLNFLSDSEFIYVTDAKNTYNIAGIVAADEEYDVVILKLEQEVGRPVVFMETSSLNTDDKLYTINSKNNVGYSINYGSFVSLENGRLKNFLAITDSDVGCALYNSEGYVVAFTVPDVLSSELSYANSTDYLIGLQTILKKKSFDEINIKSLDNFKNRYYNNLVEEVKYNNVKDSVSKELMSIGKMEETIVLPLIKASYKDNILSLRYKNEAIDSLDTLYLINEYMVNLEKEGFKKTYTKYNKLIYQNSKYKIIIKEDLDYLIILIMEN